MAFTAFCVAPLSATETVNHGYYGGGLDYSRWTLNSMGGYRVAPVAHAVPPQTPAANEHVTTAPIGQFTKSAHKEVYAVKPIYEEHYNKEGAPPHVTVKFHKQPAPAYGIRPKGRSTTFILPPLLNPKIAPIVTLTNRFPKDW